MADLTGGSNAGHEGAAQPMMSLQGSMGPVFTQMPNDQSMNYDNARPQSDTMMTEWDSTVIGSGMKGGDNASTRDSSSNGMRPDPSDY
jgi:hypothetical protein